MPKVDLHTHTNASDDGSLTDIDFARIFSDNILDFVAVTDHNTIEYAQYLQSIYKGKIIVGEEISTVDGDLIGLYLSETIPAGLSVSETADLIHDQGGLVYVPHPFEVTQRKSIGNCLESIRPQIDIVEIYNGRSLPINGNRQAALWAKTYKIPGAASSDAHGKYGWGSTYTIVNGFPNRINLIELLKQAKYHKKHLGSRAIMYPKFNRLRKNT